MVDRLGVDHAKELLHSHDRLIDEPSVLLRRADTAMPPTRGRVIFAALFHNAPAKYFSGKRHNIFSLVKETRE